MKGIAIVAIVLGLAVCSFAAQVNPTSNVLGDTAATAGTLVLRDANGVVDAANLIQDGTILTTKYGDDTITTPKLLFLNLTQGRILCVRTDKSIGFCDQVAGALTGGCSCN